jgi:hypothetical protein
MVGLAQIFPMHATRYFPDLPQIDILATQLLDLFCENGIEYFPPYESWAKRKKGSDNVWRAICYTEIMEFASLSLNAYTEKKTNQKLVKEVLIQIEQWMIQSDGQLAQVTFENGKQSWLPVCLLN